MTSPSTSLTPVAVAPIAEQVAIARDMTKSTVMRPPAKTKKPLEPTTLMLAAEASEDAAVASPIVAVWRASAENTPATLSPAMALGEGRGDWLAGAESHLSSSVVSRAPWCLQPACCRPRVCCRLPDGRPPRATSLQPEWWLL